MNFPRRICLEKNTPAEMAICTAVEEVEVAGCHPLLTSAIVLLDEAREKVADFIDLAGEENVKPAMPEHFLGTIRSLQRVIHTANHKWWVDQSGLPVLRNKGELLMLITSEISECMEGERKDLMDDKLPHRKMAEVELADAMIRILDYAAGFGYDVAGAMQEKLAYNATRSDHTYEARAQANGKKF